MSIVLCVSFWLFITLKLYIGGDGLLVFGRENLPVYGPCKVARMHKRSTVDLNGLYLTNIDFC